MPEIKCAECGEVRAAHEFRYKSTVSQAVAKGFDRPYTLTGKYCRACRNKLKRMRAKSRPTDVTKKQLLARISYARAGATREHACPLEDRVAAIDTRIVGQRRQGQFLRWEQQRARNWKPIRAALRVEESRVLNLLRVNLAQLLRLSADSEIVLKDYLDILRRARSAIDLDTRSPRSNRMHPSNVYSPDAPTPMPHFYDNLLEYTPSHAERERIALMYRRILVWERLMLLEAQIRKPLLIGNSGKLVRTSDE